MAGSVPDKALAGCPCWEASRNVWGEWLVSMGRAPPCCSQGVDQTSLTRARPPGRGTRRHPCCWSITGAALSAVSSFA